MKIQHKKEIALYCYALVPVGFVIYTIISILFQDITFPLTVRNVLHESLRNMGSLLLFSLFFYPSYIWMKKEFGRWKEEEKRG
ncbi:hypothetical protein [Bacillus siamensis]|uniref:hypothetical protein n=1 Tax=Bacillus siamensis TaxID=659243 RepID=UPI0022B7CF5E|nr:hypothetical protein [Bacillus siamensis]